MEVHGLVLAANVLGSKLRNMAFRLERGSRIKSFNSYAGYFSIPKAEPDINWLQAYSTTSDRTVLLRPDNVGELMRSSAQQATIRRLRGN